MQARSISYKKDEGLIVYHQCKVFFFSVHVRLRDFLPGLEFFLNVSLRIRRLDIQTIFPLFFLRVWWFFTSKFSTLFETKSKHFFLIPLFTFLSQFLAYKIWKFFINCKTFFWYISCSQEVECTSNLWNFFRHFY